MPSRTQRYHVSDHNAYGLQLWSPVDVLDLYEDSRCIGYAPSKGRKCRMIIGAGTTSVFNQKLYAISQQPPDPERLESHLMELAILGLCGRFHQDQAEALVEKWMRMIRRAFPTTVHSDLRRMSAVRQQLSQQINDAGRITASSVSASTPTSTRASSVSPEESTEIDSLRETIATMQETIRSAQECMERLSNSRQSSVQPPPITRISTSDISSLALSRRSTTTTDSSSITSASSSSSSSSRSSSPFSVATRASSPSDTSRTHRRLAITYPQPSAPATPSVPSSASTPTSSAPTTPSPSRPHCTTRHARRLPLPTHCPICQSGPPLSTLPPSSVVWCKSSCGQSLHASCFSQWARQRTGDGRTPTCVMCRADWTDACDCQGCLHVPRRAVEGECGICLEELRGGEGTAWCKDGCGRSVHSVCFAAWEAHCVEGGGTATCVLCRAEWTGECGC